MRTSAGSVSCTHGTSVDCSAPALAVTTCWPHAEAIFGYRHWEEAFDVLKGSLAYAKSAPQIACHVGAIHATLGNSQEAVKYLRLAIRSSAKFTGRAAAIELLDGLKGKQNLRP